MATSKTLTPTNETIQIPAMTDAPDASVFSNCIDKEADAINALNSKIDNKFRSVEGNPTATMVINNYPSFIAVRDKDSQDGILMIVTGASNAITACKWGSKTFNVSISNGSLTVGNGNILMMALG